MDRRRFKSRSGLHRGLQIIAGSSQDSTKEKDSSNVSARLSQKLSNSEMLRRQTRSSLSNLTENRSSTPEENPSVSPAKSSLSKNSDLVGKTKRSETNVQNPDNEIIEDVPSPKKTPSPRNLSLATRKKSIPSSTQKSEITREFQKSSNDNLSNKRKKNVSSDSDEDAAPLERTTEKLSNEKKKNVPEILQVAPLEKTAEKLLSKRRKIVSQVSENSPLEKTPEKLLSKRKKFVSGISDSESDEENAIDSSSSSKIRRLDPRLVSQRVEVPRSSQNRPLQLGKPLSGRSQISLRKNVSQRQSNSSQLKNMASPSKNKKTQMALIEDNEISPEKNSNLNKLDDFFRRSGIILAQDDGPHRLDGDPPMIEKKIIKLFASGKFKKDEIVDLWKTYINEEENLKKGLNDVTFVNQQANGATSNVTLVRIILQIPDLQTEVSDHLLQKLNEAVLIADSINDVPWSPLLLQQFRFLEEIVSTDSLTLRLEELLETCPIWFQRELIIFLPDIVIDIQHHAVAEMLSKLMEAHINLTGVILECIANLTLGKEYLEELREKILQMLKNNLDIGRIPAMAKFVLNECPKLEICEKVLTVIRSLDLQPLSGEKADEYFTSQTMLVSALRMSILLSKKMAQAARNVAKNTDEPPNPLDLIILLLVHADPAKKKNAEAILKQHVKSGFYRASLFNSFYQDYREVARDLQPEALELASILLKSEDRGHADFAIEWFRHQFLSQTDTIYKQREIIVKIIFLMGNNDQTAKGALDFLRRMTENEQEMKYLQRHCNHLRILLEKMDNFDLQEVSTLSDLLYALCTSASSTPEALQDDLFILLQKQLSHAKTLTKCKGVLGAAMAIKHLAGKSESCKIAEDIFLKVQNGVKDCPRSQALFYDQIGRVIADTKNIEPTFLKEITDKFQDEFVDTYMTDFNDYRGELVPKFGLNDPESEPQKCVINFGDGKSGSVVPAFFRLLRICFMRLNNGDLEDINVLLGCPVLMPKDTEKSEVWNLDLMICCINWFRELINGFVTQSDSILQSQVLKRLENVMNLQAEFRTMLTLCDSRYQPPPCYFHVFPAPPFVRIEKKITKKGRRSGNLEKTVNVPEWEAWEIGSSLCSKNSTYFRHMDATVVDLLDLKMDNQASQTPRTISKAQICFLIKELLGMFEAGEASETLIRDLVNLLPKICSKLQDVIGELREREDETKNRHAANLILSLLTTIFDWKGFKSAKYHLLLRDGLRTLAGQIDKANSMLRSSKELVAESYKYFESLADVATNISLAFGVVKMCRSLMKHSDTFTKQYKNKQANLASGFLALEWPDDKASGAAYKTAAISFLSNWLQNEPNPLETVTTVLEWLPDEVTKLEKSQDRLERLPTINKAIFHYMFQRLFEALINGVKISCAKAKTDPERIKVWQQAGNNVQKIVQICKNSSRAVLLPFLRSMISLLRIFLSIGMPIMEQNLRFQTDEVTGIMKMMQGGTRYLNIVCVDSIEKKDITLAKLVPSAKQVNEKLLYHVKAMLVYNNSSDAFWMGNLVNKNLEGQQVLSQSSDEPTVASPDDSIAPDSDDAQSEILQSDVEDQVSDEDS